ncbi:hypothetical protein B0I10_11835 [Flavobacterium lacus]|uniref:Uncharacterized protein n=1 Tax=Flavobacterium lacus TaxID=1353778 RepID=A0A328WJW7_9FLAO|nr:hypothetical protein B0I10_11835 [Flavobacterium lacus]
MILSTPQSPSTKKDALISITEVITNHLSVSRIYIFGKRLLINRQSSCFSDENQDNVLKSHFDLLVFTIKSYPDGIAFIQDQIEKVTEGSSSATIYLHREIHLQQLTEKQSFFFYNIMKSGNLIFKNSNYYFNSIFESETAFKLFN